MGHPLLYFDIETLPDEKRSELWQIKREKLISEGKEKECHAALWPEFCKIIALGWALDDSPPNSLVAGLESKNRQGEMVFVTEEVILNAFWRLVHPANKKPPILVGFNILSFDLPVIFVRSALLSVRPSRLLDRKSWGKDCIDLFDTRKYASGGGKLKELAQYYAFDVPAQEMDGSQVEKVYAENPSQISAYVESDIAVTRQLYHFYKGFFVNDYSSRDS